MEGIIFIPYLILSWLSWDSSSSNWMNLFFITEFIGSMLVFVAEDGFKDFLHKLYATIIGGIIVDTLIVIIWMGKRALYETIPYEDGLFRLLLDCIALIMVIV